MFWTDLGQNPKIERATLNGEGRTTIVSSGLVWPNDVVIDFSSNQLFWVDGSLAKVETADYNGKNRRLIFHSNGTHPFGVSVLFNTLYWTSPLDVEGLIKIDKNNGTLFGRYVFRRQLMGVAVYDRSTQPQGETLASSMKSVIKLVSIARILQHRSVQCTRDMFGFHLS